MSDIDRACAFYGDKLGFKIAFRYGDPPFYAQVARDGAHLNLRHVDGPVFDAGLRQREGEILAATLTVNGIDALCAEFQTAGTPFHQPLKAEPWGARTFIIRDPDGNLIAFAGA